MDGYAMASACTRRASVEKPLTLRVEGIIAAGDSSVWIFRDEADLIAYSCFTDVVKCAGIKFCRDEGQAAPGSTSYGRDIALSKKGILPYVEIIIDARFPPTLVGGVEEWVFGGLCKTRRRYSPAVCLFQGSSTHSDHETSTFKLSSTTRRRGLGKE
jgi:hypothetical protein